VFCALKQKALKKRQQSLVVCNYFHENRNEIVCKECRMSLTKNGNTSSMTEHLRENINI